MYRRLDVIYRKRSGETRQIGDGHVVIRYLPIRVHYFGIIFPSNTAYIESLSARCSIFPCYSRSIRSCINPSFDSYAKHLGVFFLLRGGGSVCLEKDSRISRGGGFGRFVKRPNYASNYASSAPNCYFHKCLSVNRLKFDIRPII